MTEINKIIAFCEHIMTRQLSLFDEYKETFPNIYKERVRDYFKPETLLITADSRLCKTDHSP